jgi:peptidoglycan lytic transglycosylase
LKVKSYKTTGDKHRLHKLIHFRCNLLTFPLFLISVLILQACTASRYEAGYAVASWYGPEFQGKPTSSGEIFNMYAYTCAHKEYPFGTILKVRNLSNNRSVICTVNDRGPFVSGRDIDLSYTAAKEIGLIGTGTARVWIQDMGRDSSYEREVQYLAGEGPFTIQIGSFQDLANADRLKKALTFKYGNVYIKEADIRGKRFYRVRIGRFQLKAVAGQLGETLAEEGYPVIITAYDENI